MNSCGAARGDNCGLEKIMIPLRNYKLRIFCKSGAQILFKNMGSGHYDPIMIPL
jgi:hypothetical protein